MNCIECGIDLDTREYRGDEQICTECFEREGLAYVVDDAPAPALTMLDKLCAAQDVLDEVRRQYGRGLVHFETFKAAAVYLLTLRRDAEITKYGKAKTKLDARSIASIMRG